MNNATAQQIDVIRNRHMPFSGAKNFRDLGGYKTIDGKTIRWGVLYRSDGLSKLTETDLKYLSALGLHQIVDLRSKYEKEMEADRLPMELVSRVVEIPILDTSSHLFQESREDVTKKIKRIDSSQFMKNAYTEFASRFTPELQRFINVLISSGGRPVLFHCTAGKDRTGFAAAVLLRTLGIPHELLLEDYLLSNRYFFHSHRWNIVLLRFLRGRQFAETVKGFLMTQAVYLSAAFETIDRNHGSFENYVCDGLGLTPQDVEHLKSLYLE